MLPSKFEIETAPVSLITSPTTYMSWSRLPISLTTAASSPLKSYWLVVPSFFCTIEIVLSDELAPTLVRLPSLK